ncbi:MAG TPA: TIGR04086 family membrane protein [Pseudogracilibacillus sp.]|nr:TIGR04086 family membrane protein [Pseudogracilibacillus sp.]
MKSSDIVAIGYGLLTIFICIIVASFIFSIIIHFSSMNEFTLAIMTTVTSIISLFLGGLIAGLKGKRRGWLIGVATGVFFTSFIFLIQYLGFDQTFSFEQTMYHLSFIFVATLGSVFGVNLVK